MINGFHIIITAYGFWLPNDPRGSWSTFVYSWDLFLAGGKATKVETRQSVAAKKHDVSQRLAVKEHLHYSPVIFTGEQALCCANGFAAAAAAGNFEIHACAVLPEHAHLVIGRTETNIDQVVTLLKGRATTELNRNNLHPFAPQNLAQAPTVPLLNKNARIQSPFAAKSWKVYIDSEAQMRTAIRYVERNPEKEGKPRQNWHFVKPYI